MSDGTTTYWEPWRPAVGQRVRIRLSRECRGHYSTPRLDVAAMERQIDRRTGTVVDPEEVRGGSFGAHPYLVRPDEPAVGIWIDQPDFPVRYGIFAAIELEPLE